MSHSKTRFPRFLAVALFSICMPCLAFAQSHMPQISVSGNSEITAKADQATISLFVQTQALTSAEAKKDNDKRINSLLDALNDLGIKDDAITAANMNISAQYDYQNRQQRFIGFQASRSMSVDISDLDMLHPVLDQVVQLKINNIQGISYSSSKEDALREQARAAAIEDSKNKAAELAQAYDAQLGPIYNISYQSGNISQPYMPQQEIVTLRAADSSGGRFIPGDITVTDRIHVVFDLITQ